MAACESFTFFHRLRVRWAEADAQGIVFNPNYFLYFDVGMTEYMRAIGYAYPGGMRAQGTDLFTVNANADFKASALYDDLIDVGVRVALIGRTSVKFLFAIVRSDVLLVEGSVTYVNGAIDTKAPAPLPQDFIDRVLSFESTAPERKS